MEWFKHKVASHSDPDIMEAVDEFGLDAYAVFFIILEIYAKEFNRLEEGKLKISWKVLRQKLRKSRKTSENILDYFWKTGRFLLTKDEKHVYIKIPKFIEVSSNWTTRKKTLPPEVPTEAPTAKEVEVEVRSKKEEVTTKSKKGAISEKNNKHFSMKMGEWFDSIEKSCNEITKKPPKPGQKFNPYSWVQEKANQKGHPGAIDQSLIGIVKLWDKIDHVYKYINAIYKSENQNWNEKEAIEIHEGLKKADTSFYENLMD